jgi:predicted AlkP superfamily phosphohydrolase/phosphomutase
MFWRYIDDQHPAHAGQAEPQHRNAIEEHYKRNDELVGKTMAHCDDENTVLMVISDHGCKSFRRGVDLNYWLEQNGYLKVTEGGNRKRKYLADIDWSQTKAFALGLAGIYLNIKGREARGVVEPGPQADQLRQELADKLSGLTDSDMGQVAINHVYCAKKVYRGPYSDAAPDLIIGYNEGYRVSWEAAIGQLTDQTFHDNAKAWSGDHCIDPPLVPGVLFCNRRIETEHPRLIDIGPTALDMFGVAVPKHMDGRPLAVADANGK